MTTEPEAEPDVEPPQPPLTKKQFDGMMHRDLCRYCSQCRPEAEPEVGRTIPEANRSSPESQVSRVDGPVPEAEPEVEQLTHLF